MVTDRLMPIFSCRCSDEWTRVGADPTPAQTPQFLPNLPRKFQPFDHGRSDQGSQEQSGKDHEGTWTELEPTNCAVDVRAGEEGAGHNANVSFRKMLKATNQK